MLGESHDLLHEFPEYKDKIAELRNSNEVFHNLMDEYDWLDAQIRSLEELSTPISDFYMEEMKKRRLLLKDRLYAILHA
ncbi:MAG: YdcH family protein [Candidatus Thiodiazotropha sp.]